MIKILIHILIIFFLLTACSGDDDKNSLILPPNFNEMPDPNNPEKETPQKNSEENIEKLKELLLKSE
jgi:hypothetical protein